MNPQSRAPPADPQALRPEELCDHAVYPHPVERLELLETNISLLALTGRFAYKIKKPVSLEFIDASTLERRRLLCEEELRLNARLAPDLYLAVVPIVRTTAGLRIDGTGPAVEWAVQMRQFDRNEELDALLERSAVEAPELARLAQRVAQFHERAARSIDRAAFAATSRMRDAVLGNLATLLAHFDVARATEPSGTVAPGGTAALGTLIDWTHDVLQRSARRFDAREAAGWIREGHGDLHSRNIVRWHGELVPFDCLEFEPQLRWIDVMSDVAFLVMDLGGRGRPDLAAAFLNAHLERTGDYSGVRLLPFYAVYRALVRAMVDALAAEHDQPRRGDHLARLQARLLAARRFMEPPRPMLVLMHGTSGSGKSWLSERLVTMVGALRIRSDVERARLAAASRFAPAALLARPGPLATVAAHAARADLLTYARLVKCARACLQGGFTTIVDAAALRRSDRARFRRLAADLGLPFLVLACVASRATRLARIARRRAEANDPSDADESVLELQLATMQPIEDDERAHVVEIDTEDPTAPARAQAAIRQCRAIAAPAARTQHALGRTH